MQKIAWNIVAAIGCLSLLPAQAFGEGTKQMVPTSSACGQLCIDKSRNDFAFYDGPEDYRLNIAIADASERIRFGFGTVLCNYPTDLSFRIKDPAGNVVFGPAAVPSSGTGHITSYDQAVTGPFPGEGGYSYLELDVAMTGNYFMEFFYLPYQASSGYTHEDMHMLEYVDVTIINAVGEVMVGRVWSKAWQFWSENPDLTTSRFYAKMMILSDDSIVTQLDCNGFRGGTFSIFSNPTGCTNTGNLSVDRRSREGFNTYPQYKIFLNDPDSVLFPTAKISAGVIGAPFFTPDCATGGGTIGITAAKEGTVKILIETNPSPGADPEDAEVVAGVITGYNLIIWDGNDISGRQVPNGTALTLTVTFLSGLSHLPIFDIESNDDGFIIQQIRPSGGDLQIFWDDSGIGGSYNITTGCPSMTGCHTWTNYIGDHNTINSWWFIKMDDIPPAYAISKRTPAILAITGDDIHCSGSGPQAYSVSPDPGSEDYQWSYAGTGVLILGSGTGVTLDFSPWASSGSLSVFGSNEACGEGPVSFLDIIIAPAPDVGLMEFPDMCFTAPAFLLAGGFPPGGTYYTDGKQADSLFPYKEAEGVHTVVYTYTASTGCSGSDTAKILLYSGADCEGFLLFPNAFTPNGDGSNDTFKPSVVQNIYSYRLEIYNRWGQFIYATEDINPGWDGTCEGKACPDGAYIYSVTYGISLRTDDNGKINGIVTLLR